MTEQVVTELVIDSDTSGSDRFSQAMDKAGASARDSSMSVAGMSLAIAGVGLAFIGALTGLRSFYDYVGNQNKLLVDMADNAERAGISSKEFQETLYAARSAGLSEKDFVSGLDKIGMQLMDAGRGATEFGKLFAANGLSIRGANGELIGTKQALSDITKLMQNASPQVQQGIARITGLSKDWIPFLRQGVDAIEDQKKAAADLGIIIGDDVIQQARVFDREWKAAVAGWDLQFKASLVSILPLLIQLANIASSVINTVGNITSFFTRALTKPEDMGLGDLSKQIEQAIDLRDKMSGLNGEFDRFENFRIAKAAASLGLPENADLKVVDDYIKKLAELYDAKNHPPRINISGGTTVLPPTDKSDSANALDTEIARLEKHIAVIKADTEAVGESEAARAGLRAEATLYAAAERAGFKDLEQFAERFMKIRQEVEGGTAELNKLKLASDIKFNGDTTLLSDTDRQIASILRQVYGDDKWQGMMNGPVAGQMRFNAVLKQSSDAVFAFGENLVQAFASGKTGLDALLPAMASLGSSLSKIGTDSLKSGLGTLLKGGGLSGFDPASIGIGAVGIGLSFITSAIDNKRKEQEAAEKAAEKAAKDALDRIDGYTARAQAAVIDTQTLNGQLIAFDQEAIRQRKEEYQKGAQGVVALETALAAERQAIVDKAVKDSQAAFDALVQKAQTATQKAVAALSDATSNLATALTALGKGIDSLSGGVAVAVGKLQADFAQGLVDKLNAARGVDYISSIAALVTQRQSDLADAATLGINSALVEQSFAAQVQKVIDGAELTGMAFQQMMQVFPQLVGRVREFNAVSASSVSALSAFIVKIEDFRKSLLVNAALSTLSPQAQFTEAQKQFRDTLAAANGGNATAQGNLQAAAQTYLDQAKSFYASNTQYAAIFTEVQTSLTGSQVAAQSQIDYARQQLAQLVELNKNVIAFALAASSGGTLPSSVGQAAGSTQAAASVNAAAAAAQAAAEAAKTWHYPFMDPYASLTIQKDIASGSPWPAADYARYRAEHPEARYQMGGLVTNGTYNQDSVSAMLAGGEYVMPAPRVTAATLPVLQAMRNGSASNDNSLSRADIIELARVISSASGAQIAALREEVGELRAAIDRQTRESVMKAKAPVRAA